MTVSGATLSSTPLVTSRPERRLGRPPTPTPTPASPATGRAPVKLSPTFEQAASWATAMLPATIRRMPFTVAVVVVQLVLGLATGSIWNAVGTQQWFPAVAYGPTALSEGRLWTFGVGLLFWVTPAHYLTAMAFLVVVGACELRLGTRRTAASAVLGALGGLLAASALVLLLAHTPWAWARGLASARDVGFSTGMLAVVAVTSATLRSPWRLRVRIALWFYLTTAFLFLGTLSDVAQTIAVGVGFIVGQQRYGVERGYGPQTRRETRIVACGGLLMIGLIELMVLLFPGDGPFGSTVGKAGPLLGVTLNMTVIVIVAAALRLGRRWAWWVTAALGLVDAASAVTALVLVLVGKLPNGAPTTLGTGLVWVGLLVLLLGNRRAFRVPWRRRLPGGVARTETTLATARRLLTSVGGSTMSWMTMWPETRYYMTADGRGYVGYQRHAGVAIALSDPIVPPDTIPSAVAEFATTSEQGGMTPCLFSVTAPVARAAESLGWRSVQIAEDALIPLSGLTFTGKAWQDVRSAINRAKRESLRFELVTLAEQPFSVLAQVRAISEEWVGSKDLPEMGFTLGGVEEALDPAVRVGIAVDSHGDLHGVTSWLPVYGPGGHVRGWTLDVMRRRADGFRPVMEFMIASACTAFAPDRAEFVSLSGAPLARAGVAADDLARIDRVLDRLGGALEPVYGFRSLHAFKAKFQPRYEPIYLAYRDEAELPRIGVALTRAYLPDATARQLVRAAMNAHD